MTRTRLLLIVVLPTLLVGLVVGGLLLVAEMDRREQVRAADATAAAYADRLESFRADLGEEVGPADLEEPTRVGDVVAEAAEELPELESVGEQGAQGSAAYRSARSLAQQTQENLDAVQQAVEQAVEAEQFVDAAQDALAVDPNSFVAETSLPDGGPVRAQILPPLRSTLAEVEALPTPEGAKEARSAVIGALRYVIDEVTTLAAELDAGRSYRFEFGTRYGEASTAVLAFESQAQGDLREAFDRLVGEPAAAV